MENNIQARAISELLKKAIIDGIVEDNSDENIRDE